MQIIELRAVIRCVFFAMLIGVSAAQHDMQRDAVKMIALQDYAKATARLESRRKPFGGDAELHFVEGLNLLAQDKLALATGKMRKALEAGLPPGRLAAGPWSLLRKLPKLEGVNMPELVHGPMIGNLTESGASIWLRTRDPAEVSIEIDGRKIGAQTSADQNYTAVLKIDGLKPNSIFEGSVRINGAKVDGGNFSFTTTPSAVQPKPFSIAFGGGAGFVDELEYMWDTILARKPLAFLTLGDNVYIDDPKHPITHHYCYSRRQSRPEWRRLVSATAVYSIWDDHDFGLNDCNPGPAIESPTWKREVWNIFRQNWVNPGYGGGERQPGCWYDFKVADVHFFMLDGRYYRDQKGGSMLGPIQKAWLKEKLMASEATFKVLVSPVPFAPNIKKGSKDPWDGFPDERAEIFSWIPKQKMEGVFIVAADRHRTDLRKIQNPGSYPLLEFQSSKLTNKHTHSVVKTEGLIWGYNKTCSFGMMHFDTTKEDPQVRFELVDIKGKTHQEYTLKLSRLKLE